jgi:hypothetical protein
MSYNYYLVDKENKILVRVGRGIEEFEEGVKVLEKLYNFMEEYSEFDLDLNIKVKDLKLRTLQVLLNLWDLISELDGCLSNATLLSMAYAFYCLDESELKNLRDRCIGEEELKKYKDEGYKIIG